METGCGSFALIGGDKRQLFCARSLCDDGYAVSLGGFDTIGQMNNIEITSPFEAALMSEIIILPLPSLNQKGCVPAPFSKEDIVLTDDILTAMKGKKVFCGMKDRLLSVYPQLTANTYDYYDREEFAVCNAVATAEGAIEIAMGSFEGTINGAKCLVCGYGRIGKALCNILRSMGAKLTVSARKPSDLAWIDLMGVRAVRTDELYKESGYDIIFNTVDVKVIDDITLKSTTADLMIDLSTYGGFSLSAAEEYGIKAIKAPGLPGKVAPKTAAEILCKTVTHIINSYN